MQIFNSILIETLKRRIKRIEKFMFFPEQVQENQFFYLIKKAQNTKWGKKYDYNSIRNISDYQNRVPISTYEDLYPYIHRILAGEANVLWSESIHCFSKSSGTTNNKSKYIPVSKQAIHASHYQGGKDMLALYFNNYPKSHFLSGKSLSISGSLEINPYNSKTICGDISAILTKNLPFWVTQKRIPTLKITLLKDWEEKIGKIAKMYLNTNVTCFVGVPTWIIVLLKHILEHTGKSYISEIWKNIEVFFHGAIAFSPYRKTFKDLVGNDLRYVETYNASEGFFGIQDQSDNDSMLLMLDYGIFYEFIPLENIHEFQPQTLTLDQIEIGKIYSMIISTNAGLWRYAIGDTIRFTEKKPYRFKIVGRTKHYINAFGEELMIENAEEAIRITCEETQTSIDEFTAAPTYLNQNQKGYHEWLIEFSKSPKSLDHLKHFTYILDNELKKLNSDYEAKRQKNLALLAPVVRVVPEGTFYRWLKKQKKLGGQHKVPRLSNNRRIVEDVLKMLR